ncbi:MAG: helix-turn-helix domain-containing protein [Bauldia sp.]|nr:helix-turn-helix domain-containing protein [Bauldia sp.]
MKTDAVLTSIADNLEALKKLQIMSLLRDGYSQSEIALALGVSQPTISRMFPKGALGKERNGSNG